jgi:hypothetical protein
MSFGEDMAANLLTHWHVRCFLESLPIMKHRLKNRVIAGCMTSALCLLPSIAAAHPGHHHPDENDEFDALRANFLHLHGNLEIGLAACALAGVIVFIIARKRPVRIAAAITLCGSLAMLAFS